MPKESLGTKEWLTARDVAEILELSMYSVRCHCETGQFKTATRSGPGPGPGRWIIHRDEVVALAQKKGGKNA